MRGRSGESLSPVVKYITVTGCTSAGGQEVGRDGGGALSVSALEPGLWRLQMDLYFSSALTPLLLYSLVQTR